MALGGNPEGLSEAKFRFRDSPASFGLSRRAAKRIVTATFLLGLGLGSLGLAGML